MKFLRKKLKNGITVIMEKRESPVVAFSIANRFGASSEDSNIKGIAQFIEHLLFTGTETRTHEDISREIEKKGGILNAFTSHEVTSFWFKLPKEHLFAGMDILIDMLNNPTFDEEKFNKEKKVILEEIKMYKDDPQRAVFELIEKAMYEKPFGDLVIGNEKTVSSLQRDFVRKFFKDNYFSENFFVTVVGDADFDKVCDYIEKNFEKRSGKIDRKKIKLKHSRLVEKREGVDQANFIMGMHAPLMTEKEHSTLDVLDAYLASGMSSRLFLEIREKRGLAYTVKGDVTAEKSYAHYLIYAGTTKEKVDEVEKIIVEEFKKINEMNEKQLEESKERLIGLKKVSSEESVGVMNSLIFYEIADKAENYYKFEEKIRKVTLREVKDLAKKIIKNYSVAAILPK